MKEYRSSIHRGSFRVENLPPVFELSDHFLTSVRTLHPVHEVRAKFLTLRIDLSAKKDMRRFQERVRGFIRTSLVYMQGVGDGRFGRKPRSAVG